MNKVRITESAGGLVVNPKGEILVVNQNGDSWSLPKGHIDPGESPLEAAKREIYEESGVSQVTLVKELGSYERYRIAKGGGDDRTELKKIHMFFFKTTTRLLRPVDPDNPEARWASPEEAAGLLTHPKDREFFLSCKPLLC
jgi:diadenosine hexaphosphate hydrolase (ATP-forming)